MDTGASVVLVWVMQGRGERMGLFKKAAKSVQPSRCWAVRRECPHG